MKHIVFGFLGSPILRPSRMIDSQEIPLDPIHQTCGRVRRFYAASCWLSSCRCLLGFGMLDLGFGFSWKWSILPHGNFQERNDSPWMSMIINDHPIIHWVWGSLMFRQRQPNTSCALQSYMHNTQTHTHTLCHRDWSTKTVAHRDFKDCWLFSQKKTTSRLVDHCRSHAVHCYVTFTLRLFLRHQPLHHHAFWIFRCQRSHLVWSEICFLPLPLQAHHCFLAAWNPTWASRKIGRSNMWSIPKSSGINHVFPKVKSFGCPPYSNTQKIGLFQGRSFCT